MAFETAKVAKVNGTTLAYCEQGEGEPVVFVHGGLGDLRIWQPQLPAIGSAYRAITYSRRYSRPNQEIPSGTDDPWLTHVDDLAAFVRELGAAPAHIVGNSQGAFISLLTAVRHPDIVRTLVLEEPPVIPLFVKSVPPGPLELLRLIVTRPRLAFEILKFGGGILSGVQKAFERGDDEEAMLIFIRGVLGDKHFDRLGDTRKAQALENVSTMRAFALGDSGFPPLDDDDVRGVNVPVLLLTGDDSPRMAHLMTDRLEELLPNVERAGIPDASHDMHLDNPSAASQAILGFLARCRGGSTLVA
jgi:pimeloyl-ACP methyl ester carboxylesterase